MVIVGNNNSFLISRWRVGIANSGWMVVEEIAERKRIQSSLILFPAKAAAMSWTIQKAMGLGIEWRLNNMMTKTDSVEEKKCNWDGTGGSIVLFSYDNSFDNQPAVDNL